MVIYKNATVWAWMLWLAPYPWGRAEQLGLFGLLCANRILWSVPCHKREQTDVCEKCCQTQSTVQGHFAVTEGRRKDFDQFSIISPMHC